MPKNIRMALNGVPFWAVDGRIIQETFTESAIVRQRSTVMLGSHVGQHVSAPDVKEKQFEQTFKILERDPRERALVMNKINAWAMNGGQLTADNRPGLFADVVCTQLPDAVKWTDEMTMGFSAFEVPYWQSADDKLNGTETFLGNSFSTFVPGNVPTPLSFSFKNNLSTAATTLYVQCNGQKIQFNGISLAQNETLVWEYEGRIAKGYILDADGVTKRSVMGNRTADSADDIMLPPGKATVQHTAAMLAFTTKFTARGRWA